MSSSDASSRSLRYRLALSLMAGTLAVLLPAFLGLHLLIRGELYSNLDQGLSHRTESVAAYAAAHPGSESVVEFMPQFRTRAHQDFFQVWDGSGRTLARSDSSAGRDLPRLGVAAGLPVYQDLWLPDGHRGRAVAASFPLPAGDPRRVLTVVTAEETENLERLESRMHVVLLLGAIGTVVALMLIARHAVLRALLPVDRLSRELECVDPDNPPGRLEFGPLPGELRPVADRFTELLNRLLASLARERNYARNVAHELRTPLAEIRLLTDVGARAEDAHAVRAALRDVGAAAAGMEQAVESLLALARLEARLEQPQPEPMEICAELRRTAGSLKSLADARGHTFGFDLPGETWVHTDSALMRRLLGNLLGNAVAHSPQGSTIGISLNRAAELQIANPAPQLTTADVPRLGERFFRVGVGAAGTHSGLGLSIADALARVLGVRLAFDLRENKRLVVTLCDLPVLRHDPQLTRQSVGLSP